MTDPTISQDARYFIRKGGAFYRPNAEGYTRDTAEAGRFTLEEAIAHSHPNGPDGPRDGIDYIEAHLRTPATDTEAMRLLNCEEIGIAHGQQVSITFKDPADAFALFNELKSRARIDAVLAKRGA